MVHFANDEKFVHHAFVDTPQFKADTGDIPPGERRDIVFTQGRHLHRALRDPPADENDG